MTSSESPQAGQAPAADGLRPTLAELVALRAAATRLPPPRRGRHGLSGSAPAAVRGRGMEYAESREYVAGDDVRHIDWRLTARSGRTHTKLFQAERERLSLIVADTAPALYFGTRVRFKSVQAARAGAIAAWAAQRQGDRLAALRGSRSEAPVPPASGPRGALRVLDALARWYAQPPQDDAGLDVALEHAAKLLRPGSRLVVLADPHSALQIAASRWAGLAMHNEVVVLLLVDALELTPPRATLPFWAGGQRVEVDLAGGAARERWHEAFVAPVEALLANLPGRGVQVRTLRSDAPSESWLLPGATGLGAR
ncbi:DUF58 domain-containing protein [Xanthomonas sp.]|uniref:DUF58 domain-containing protein n=1 Tax=Xanthomonas sp. TaxID=29446 RepID=UPI003D18E7C2